MSDAVSVAMAVHDGLAFLPEQIESILVELGPEDELVVVDDASRDGSREWLAALDEPRLHLHVNETNLGIRATFERALTLTRNQIVFLADQDDVWLPGKRAAFVHAFQSDPQVLVVISDAELIDRDGSLLAPSFMATRGGFRGSWRGTIVRNRYLGCAMAVRRGLFDVALPIPAAAPMHDMWLGALGSIVGRVRYLPVPYLRYRRHDRNATPPVHGSLPSMLAARARLLFTLSVRLVTCLATKRTPRRSASS